MKRKPLKHTPVFEDELFAGRYAKKHAKMGRRFGNHYLKLIRNKHNTPIKIADMGCGSGQTLITLGEQLKDCECIGIDLSGPLLKMAKETIAQTTISDRIQFFQENVQSTSFENNTFDVTINLNMLHLVDAPKCMLDEMERITKPSGSIFMTDIRRSVLGYLEREFLSAFSLKEFTEAINRSRLRTGTISQSLMWLNYVSG
ncbi:MAG: methyltransferase domain-containing protein [Caldithrix sp.]|nr:methyltransferase domain-containing protein [Caldithrix sp.]